MAKERITGTPVSPLSREDVETLKKWLVEPRREHTSVTIRGVDVKRIVKMALHMDTLYGWMMQDTLGNIQDG